MKVQEAKFLALLLVNLLAWVALYSVFQPSGNAKLRDAKMTGLAREQVSVQQVKRLITESQIKTARDDLFLEQVKHLIAESQRTAVTDGLSLEQVKRLIADSQKRVAKTAVSLKQVKDLIAASNTGRDKSIAKAMGRLQFNAVSLQHKLQMSTGSDKSGRLIFDFGMNKGGDTSYYLSLGYTVVAVEGSPMVASRAKQNFKSYIDSGQLTIVNAAIGPEAGKTVKFYSNPRVSEKSSFTMEGCCFGLPKGVTCEPGQHCKVESVQTQTCLDIVEQYAANSAPLYIKIDIQGYDSICLDSLTQLPQKLLPQFISSEGVENLQRMKALGYGSFKVQDCTNLIGVSGVALDKTAALEWNKADTRYLQITGPFGHFAWDELYGYVWTDAEVISNTIAATTGKWVDLHGCLFDCFRGVTLQDESGGSTRASDPASVHT